MKRKLAFIFLLFVLGVIGYLGFSIYVELKKKQLIKDRITTLPEFTADGLNGNMIRSKSIGGKDPFILTYFHTECEFCRAEISSIQDYTSLQERAVIYLISDEPSDVLKQFNKEFELDSLQNIKVLQDSTRQVKELFGIRGVPSTFVYNWDYKLLESFVGETKAEVLYKLLVSK